MIIVVGGQARKVGKTTAVCDIIAATREARWVAVKHTAHSHATDWDSGGETDTDRYLAAGAERAVLLDPSADLPPAQNLILESNGIIERLKPDLFVFVTDSGNPEWKESALRVHAAADIVVDRRLSSATVAFIAAILLSSSEVRE